MPLYETTFILLPDLEEADLEKNIQRYTGIITGGGGKIEKEERWGLRRMAYEIKKRTQGYYVHLLHDSGPDIPRELERQFLLNENCIRYLTVRAEKPVPEPEPKKTPFKDETPEVTDTEKSEAGGSGAANARSESGNPRADEENDDSADGGSNPNDEKAGA